MGVGYHNVAVLLMRFRFYALKVRGDDGRVVCCRSPYEILFGS